MTHDMDVAPLPSTIAGNGRIHGIADGARFLLIRWDGMRGFRPSVSRSCFVGALAGVGLLVACSTMDEAAFDGSPGSQGPLAEAGAEGPNAAATVIAVHASYNFPAFRICLQGLESLPPLPDRRTMPQSNLIGVEIGNAVHLGDLPLPGASSFDGGFSARPDTGVSDASDAGDRDGDAGIVVPGVSDAGREAGPAGTTKVYVIDEAALRGKTGTCQNVLPTLSASDVATLTVTDAEASTLFTSNASFIALTGCRSGVPLTDAAAIRACGSDYLADTGNLRLSVIGARYQARFASGFYAQVLPLSPSLAMTSVEFGELSGEPTNPAQNVGATPPYRAIGPTAPFPVSFRGLESDFGRFGFRVYDTTTPSMRKLLREQTLADIATFSDPRLLPTEYFALPSNFVVLLIGNPDDVTRSVEPGRKLHFVAVPLREPTIDADAGP